jgi:hypothetical protein
LVAPRATSAATSRSDAVNDSSPAGVGGVHSITRYSTPSSWTRVVRALTSARGYHLRRAPTQFPKTATPTMTGTMIAATRRPAKTGIFISRFTTEADEMSSNG